MALNLKNEEADRLARQLAGLTGETITETVIVALRERLERQRREGRQVSHLQRLAAEVARLPVVDHRSADEIVGYGVQGLPA